MVVTPNSRCKAGRDRDASRTPRVAAIETKPGNAEEVNVVWSRNSIESLFLDAPVLTEWLTAFLGDPPVDGLAEIVERAISAADLDDALGADAKRIYIDAKTTQDTKIDSTLREAKTQAFLEAETYLKQNPHVWQKGRERARVILRTVHAALPAKRQAAFPVDLARIIGDAPAERIRELKIAIPAEVQTLLEIMVEP